ncbi:MAG TPA: RNA-binding cell elongation regulator Jag/EloR [Caldilineaceae bacterium]|mgnify:CR=1 FL=1|nr:RNA-binding cell elongation regulator Jag/EloR [Caldilineaceae bacterium]
MATQEFKAKSIDEAIAEGLAVLGVERNAVDIEIINKGSRGIFGIGSEPAVVRLTLRSTAASEELSQQPDVVQKVEERSVSEEDEPSASLSNRTAAHPQENARLAAEDDVDDDEFADDEADDSTVDMTENYDDQDDEYDSDDEFEELDVSVEEEDLAAMAADMLEEMIHLMGFKAEVTSSWFDEDDDDFDDDEGDDEAVEERRTRYLRLDVEGTDLGALIGRRGETLENIQYLLRLMVNQKIHRWKNIIVDVEHYKERRVNQLTQLAERMAEQVARSGRAISLEPMPANERRIIHMVLRNHPDVYTESYGEGPRRKVHIFARDE